MTKRIWSQALLGMLVAAGPVAADTRGDSALAALSPAQPVAERILIAGGYSKMFPGVQREHPGFNDSTYFYDPSADTYTRGPDVPHAPVPDRDSAGDPGPAPMIGAPAVVWRNLAVAVSGEVRIATRSPQVLALPLPAPEAK